MYHFGAQLKNLKFWKLLGKTDQLSQMTAQFTLLYSQKHGSKKNIICLNEHCYDRQQKLYLIYFSLCSRQSVSSSMKKK